MDSSGILPWDDELGGYQYQPDSQLESDFRAGVPVSSPAPLPPPPPQQSPQGSKRLYDFDEDERNLRQRADDHPGIIETPPITTAFHFDPNAQPPPILTPQQAKDELLHLLNISKRVLSPWTSGVLSPFSWWQALREYVTFDTTVLRSPVAVTQYRNMLVGIQRIYDKVLEDYPFIVENSPIVDGDKARMGIVYIIQSLRGTMVDIPLLKVAEKNLFEGYGMQLVLPATHPPPTQPPPSAARGRGRGGPNPPPTGRGRGVPNPPPTGRGGPIANPPAGRGAPNQARPAPQEGDRNFELPDALNNINDPCYASLKKALFKGKVLLFFLKKNGIFFLKRQSEDGQMKDTTSFLRNPVPNVTNQDSTKILWSNTIGWNPDDVNDAYDAKRPDQLYQLFADLFLIQTK